ncbi:ROK family glucokinase [Microbacterium mitrae]|uniref:ROK family protein n=1 Tax=Microbacterium mitrae TaxID=664640 RepID=A0A5C8HN54_9MICO|nr:ROK family protein [Microbacterium mitrae]TXK04886.1 ROK family protein [Microbacterium mitrae]
MFTIGIDIGGTKIAAGLVAEDGSLHRPTRVATSPSSDAIVAAVVHLVHELSADAEVSAVGVAAAGFVDHEAGTISSPNIAWRDEPLRERVQSEIDLPMVLENDANAAGWAEYRFGAGRDVRNMVMLTMGTGIGGAVVSDGVLHRGATGMGAELGHVRFERGGLLCGCGQRGCIEQYASGRALQRVANDLADAGGIGVMLAERRARDGEIAGHAISELALAGDRGALEAVRSVSAALGEACGSFHAILEPQRYVIGGGVAALGELVLSPLREAFLVHSPMHQKPVDDMFQIAQLVNDAGVIGAGDLARAETS